MSHNEREDALYVRESTTVDEIVQFVRKRARNPVQYGGNTVWNFSQYQFKEDAFEQKRHDEFLIPYEVPGTWATMFVLLPERIRNAEILVYRSGEDQYVAYKNFYREVPSERREQFQSSLSRAVSDEGVVFE